MTAMMVTINRIVNAEGKENLRFFFSLLGFFGRDWEIGFHGCLGHDDLLSESGRNAVMPSHGPPSESPSEPLAFDREPWEDVMIRV